MPPTKVSSFSFGWLSAPRIRHPEIHQAVINKCHSQAVHVGAPYLGCVNNDRTSVLGNSVMCRRKPLTRT